jgi:membrane protein DedA with SNARE-associated domain
MDHYIIPAFVENLSYLGIFVAMALSGHLVPVPEEILLLLIGYTSGIGLSNVYWAFIFAFFGVIVGDVALFLLSRTGSHYVDKLKNRIAPEKLARYENLMKAHAGKTIFLSRFIITVRFFSPILAGSLKINWKTFALADFSAAAIYVGVSIFLGYHFNNDIASLITEVKLARHIIFILLITVIGLLLSYWAGKKFLRKINGDSKL